MVRPVVDADSTTDPPPTDSPGSPCERLWARYHESLEEDKVEILEELLQHGCLERAQKTLVDSEETGT